MYCAGGVCGLVLTKADKNKCPAPCGTFDQCSECLHHSHCGWCALEGANGQGVCAEGSIDSPLDYSTRTTCAAVYESVHQTNTTNNTFSWHYTRCPPENECENNHHQCKAESEVSDVHIYIALVFFKKFWRMKSPRCLIFQRQRHNNYNPTIYIWCPILSHGTTSSDIDKRCW